jgi:anti-anti-sigma factor
MPLTVRDTDNTRIISVSGRFDFDVHREFREAYKNAVKDINFILDLQSTEYLDSSALGMILLLREFVNEDRRRLRIINSNPQVKEIFAVCNMDKIIDIS